MLRRLLEGEEDDSAEPMDTEDQEKMIASLHAEHRHANIVFTRAFLVLMGIVAAVFGLFAYRQEMYHFGRASETLVGLASWCIAVQAVICGARIYRPESWDYDEGWGKTQQSRRMFLAPAACLCVFPTCYLAQLSLAEQYASYEHTGGLFNGVALHQLVTIFPPLLLAMTEYVAYNMQTGFHEIHNLESTIYKFKSL